MLALLAFVTAVLLAAVGTLIVDAISPGALGRCMSTHRRWT
ncbi:hypothetical protein P0F65_00755 [Sphingomonas sp. I4]